MSRLNRKRGSLIAKNEIGEYSDLESQHKQEVSRQAAAILKEAMKIEASELFGRAAGNETLSVYQKKAMGPFFVVHNGVERRVTRKQGKWLLLEK